MNTHLIENAKNNLGINIKKLINKVCKVNVTDTRSNEHHTFVGLILDTDTSYFINFSHPVECNEKVCTCGEIGLSVYDDVQYSVYKLESVEHITEKEFNNWLICAIDMDLSILKNKETQLCEIEYKDIKKY